MKNENTLLLHKTTRHNKTENEIEVEKLLTIEEEAKRKRQKETGKRGWQRERDRLKVGAKERRKERKSAEPPLNFLKMGLRWFGTVLGRTKCANFFVKTYCLWHKQLENEIIIGGHRAPFFRKWVRTLLFLTFLSMEWMGKWWLACL